MIFKLFASGPEHPLADAKELRRVLDEIPADHAFKAIDELAGWLESLEHAENFRADKLNDVVRQLDDAAQPHMRRLSRQYLTSPRLSKMEERRFWTTSIEFWNRLATVYEMALHAGAGKDKAADGLKAVLPLIASRLIYALAAEIRWTYFKYGPPQPELWKRLGAAYLFAEDGKHSARAQPLYPGLASTTTPAQEYLQALVLAASSLDSLLPVEIELADKLLAHFRPHFVLSAQDRPDNLYWVDPALGQPPQRLAKAPRPSTSLRFIAAGKAPAAMAEMIRVIERGDLPAELPLGGQYSPRLVLNVLRHVANYWAEQPPLRQHKRHPVKSRLFVLHGFDTCATMFGGAAGALGESAETWVVDNVSLGGFGALVACQREEWLRIGALLCVQPEGGDNWLLGVVRRYGKESDAQAGVGIQTLAKQATTVQLRPRGSAAYAVASGLVGISFRDGAGADEVRLVLPANTFDPRESFDAEIDGRMTLLSPLELVDTGVDFEVARYRARVSQ